MFSNLRLISIVAAFSVLLCFLLALTCGSGKESYEDFHLYLLIGQSNMAGRGKVEAQDKEIHPRVFTLNKENKWVPAVDPIHFDKKIAGVGPGLTFGKAMAERKPNVRIGLIPCAAGGSPISTWKTGAIHKQTNSRPYDDALKRTKIAMKDGVLKGILWHQGESDSIEEAAELYEERLVLFINKLRQELQADNVPFIVGELGEFYIQKRPLATIINEALARITQRVGNTAFVESKDLDHNGDGIHFSSESARELGRRYAEAMFRLEQ